MNYIRTSLQLLALLVCFSIARGAEASILTAYGVDSALGGPMAITAFSSSSNGNDYTVTVTATDTSATASFANVGLTLQFIYPADGSQVTDGNGFNYLGSANWESADTSKDVQFTGSSPFGSILQSLAPSQISVPLSDSSGGFTAGPLSTSDSIPMVQLGNFNPGDMKSFTVTATSLAGGAFRFNTVGYFVAAPEPSSIAMAIIGGIALVFAQRRRWILKSQV